jgi:beta-glucanase (GH16 family)
VSARTTQVRWWNGFAVVVSLAGALLLAGWPSALDSDPGRSRADRGAYRVESRATSSSAGGASSGSANASASRSGAKVTSGSSSRSSAGPVAGSSSSQVSASPTTDPCAPMPKAGGGTWECTLDDQFEGSALDQDRWVPQETGKSGFHSGPECLVDSRDNIAVADGVLRLTARKEAKAFTCPSPRRPFTTQYTGAQVSTFGRFSQAYGRFEVRARFPGTASAGVQAAVWLWPEDLLRPLGAEIDIAEWYSAFADRVIPYVHTGSSVNTHVTNNYCMVSNASGLFHTYVLEWTPLSLSFIYDGRACLIHEFRSSDLDRLGHPFDRPFIIALSQLLGVGNNAFDPDTTQLPATTEVDYVRVWK